MLVGILAIMSLGLVITGLDFGNSSESETASTDEGLSESPDDIADLELIPINFDATAQSQEGLEILDGLLLEVSEFEILDAADKTGDISLETLAEPDSAAAAEESFDTSTGTFHVEVSEAMLSTEGQVGHSINLFDPSMSLEIELDPDVAGFIHQVNFDLSDGGQGWSSSTEYVLLVRSPSEEIDFTEEDLADLLSGKSDFDIVAKVNIGSCHWEHLTTIDSDTGVPTDFFSDQTNDNPLISINRSICSVTDL